MPSRIPSNCDSDSDASNVSSDESTHRPRAKQRRSRGSSGKIGKKRRREQRKLAYDTARELILASLRKIPAGATFVWAGTMDPKLARLHSDPERNDKERMPM